MLEFNTLTIPEGEVVKIEDSLGRVLWQKASPLPYVEFDYLQTDGTAYIDTGIENTYTSIKAEMQALLWNTSSSSQILFGFYTGAGTWIGENGGSWAVGASNKIPNVSTSTKTSLVAQFDITNGRRYVTLTIEESSTTRSGTFSDVTNFAICGSLRYPAYAKIYSLKMYDLSTNVLLRDFKPCTYQGEAGMWDVVNNQFYGNANSSGTLTVGNDA